MNWLSDYYQSTIGKKAVMAVTGLLLFAYVFFHMLGNLQIYLPGPDGRLDGYYINRYAQFLHSTPAIPLLWGARILLLTAVLLHVITTIQLFILKQRARPQGYARRKYEQTDITSRTMIWTGPAIGLFVTYHILHLTTGSLHQPFIHADAFANLVSGFSVWWISVIYMAAVALLGLHFHHALWSWVQTLGIGSPTSTRRVVSTTLTLLVVVGDISFPIAVLAGVFSRHGGV